MKKLTITWIFALFCYVFSRTHFDTLRVKPTASEDEIKKSYRILAKQYHPDKNKHDPDAQSKFIEITKAYEVLSDQKSRLEYIDSLRYQNRPGNAKMQDWTSRNMETDTNFQEFQRFQKFPQQGNTFYAYRTPDGRVLYTSRSQNQGQNFQYSYQYSSSNNNNGSFFVNVMYALGMIAWVLIQPFLPIILLVVFLSILYNIFCRVALKPKTPEIPTNRSRLTAPKPIETLRASDVRRKGIVIVATTSEAVSLCRRLQRSFLNDPVYFAATAAEVSSETEHDGGSGGVDDAGEFPLLAITRGGSKWVGLSLLKHGGSAQRKYKNDYDREDKEGEEEDQEGEEEEEEDEEDEKEDEEQRLKRVEDWIIQLLNGGLSWRHSSFNPLPISLP